MKRRQELTIFNMSFLDCISCGFGATVLIFMLMKHAALNLSDPARLIPHTAVSGQEDQLLDERQKLLVLRRALDDVEKATETASREAAALRKKIDEARSAMPEKESGAETGRARVLQLEDELKALEAKVQGMRAAAADNSGDASRRIVGEGRRQYLSGLTVSGRHVLVLVDASGSMLGDTIVDAIRRRNMDASAQLASPKWKRTTAAVDWLAAQLGPDAQFQIYLFNDTVTPAVAGSLGRWLSVGGRELDDAVTGVRRTAPGKGTSLAKAFAAIANLSPAPDNVYLITDGLPTMGRTPVSGAVSGRDRVKYFNEAVSALPRRLAINVILMPMEGDPKASAAYWELAQRTGGAYFDPSKDWP